MAVARSATAPDPSRLDPSGLRMSTRGLIGWIAAEGLRLRL